MAQKVVLKVWGDELVFNKVSQNNVEFEIPQKALKFWCAYISKMMTFEVPVKYLSRIEKVTIEESCLYEEGEIALSKVILMF